MFNQYAEALKRLTNAGPTALGQPDPGMSMPGAAPAGLGAPAAGAGPASVLGAPQVMGGADAPQPSALQAPPKAQGAPVGIAHLVDGASDKDKEHVASQMEKSGVDIPGKYAEVQKQAGLPDEPKLSRKEKGMRLMEFGLRLMAASRDNDAATAIGIAGAGLMESIQARKDKTATEATRVGERNEDRTDKRTEAEAGRTATRENEQGTRKSIESEGEKNRKNALEIARIQAERDAKRGVKNFTDDQGRQWNIDEDGNATPVTATTEVDEAVPGTGSRGRKPMTRKVPKKTQLKGQLRTNAAGLDQDTILRQITERKKQIIEDGKLGRQLKGQGLNQQQIDEQIDKTARDQVMKDTGALSGGGQTVDWNDL